MKMVKRSHTKRSLVFTRIRTMNLQKLYYERKTTHEWQWKKPEFSDSYHSIGISLTIMGRSFCIWIYISLEYGSQHRCFHQKWIADRRHTERNPSGLSKRSNTCFLITGNCIGDIWFQASKHFVFMYDFGKYCKNPMNVNGVPFYMSWKTLKHCASDNFSIFDTTSSLPRVLLLLKQPGCFQLARLRSLSWGLFNRALIILVLHDSWAAPKVHKPLGKLLISKVLQSLALHL